VLRFRTLSSTSDIKCNCVDNQFTYKAMFDRVFVLKQPKMYNRVVVISFLLVTTC